MSTFQKIIIVGHLGDAPKTTQFQSGGQITQISVATTEYWNDRVSGEKKSLTEWHRVLLRDKLSELADKYLKKGSKILIEGKNKTRKYTDGNNVERYVTEVVADKMTFMGGPDEGSAQPKAQTQTEPQPTERPQQSSDDHDDLPF